MSNIVIEIEAIKQELTECITKYMELEKNKSITALKYQQDAYYTMGKISTYAAFLNLPWKYDETAECYYAYINRLINSLELDIQERLLPVNQRN